MEYQGPVSIQNQRLLKELDPMPKSGSKPFFGQGRRREMGLRPSIKDEG